MFKNAVWGRMGEGTLSQNMFYSFIGAILTWGFVMTYFIAEQTVNWQPGLIAILVVGLLFPIVGIVISMKSQNPIISFIGFNIVITSLGAILGPTLASYTSADASVVSQAALVTALVTALMAVTGFLFPQFYSKIGGALFVALICLIIVRILQIFIPSLQNFGALDYIAAGLFALYIGYDMWRASTIPATLDNAVDVAVSLYLDIINLFLNMLSIFGNNNN